MRASNMMLLTVASIVLLCLPQTSTANLSPRTMTWTETTTIVTSQAPVTITSYDDSLATTITQTEEVIYNIVSGSDAAGSTSTSCTTSVTTKRPWQDWTSAESATAGASSDDTSAGNTTPDVGSETTQYATSASTTEFSGVSSSGTTAAELTTSDVSTNQSQAPEPSAASTSAANVSTSESYSNSTSVSNGLPASQTSQSVATTTASSSDQVSSGVDPSNTGGTSGQVSDSMPASTFLPDTTPDSAASSNQVQVSSIATQVTVTSEVTNFLPQPDGSTLTQISTITPVMSTTVLVTAGASNNSSASSAGSPGNGSSASSDVPVSGSSDLSSATTALSSSADLGSASAAETTSTSSLAQAKDSSTLVVSSSFESSALSGTPSSLTPTNAVSSTEGFSDQSSASTSTTQVATNSDGVVSPRPSLVTENNVTYTVVVSIITDASTTRSETRLAPLVPSVASTTPAVVGPTISLSVPTSTVYTPFVVPNGGFDNPMTRTTSCVFAPSWTSTTLSYDPWCVESAGTTACLCPYCATVDFACLKGVPQPGTCKDGWLCDVTIPTSASTATWVLPPGSPNVPSSWAVWDRYSTCVTAADQQSCSSVTWTAQLSSSTSTDADGVIWAFGVRSWSCPDALCNPSNFILKILGCLLRFNCFEGLFEGFPKAPELVIPPINPPQPPELAKQTQPTSVGSVSPTGSPSASVTTTNTESQSSSSSTCTDESTFTYTTRFCSTVSASNTTTVTNCSDAVATQVGCTGTGSITTSTVPCSSGVQTGHIVDCPSNYTTSAECWTNTTYTYTGCSATTSTSILACSLNTSVDYNDPGIASTLSAWLAGFSFDLPTAYTTTTNGSTMTVTYSTEYSSNSTFSSSSSDTQNQPSSIPSSVAASTSSATPGASATTSTIPSSSTSLPPKSTVASPTSSPASSTSGPPPVGTLPPDTEAAASFSNWNSADLASQASSVASASASAAASAVAFIDHPQDGIKEYCSDESGEGKGDKCGQYYCNDELSNVLPFAVPRGEDGYYNAHYTRMRNAACWYMWDEEEFDISKGYYFDWTNASSTYGYIPVIGEHNLTFTVQYVGSETNPARDRSYWSYGQNDYPGRCLDGFQFAVEHCYCNAMCGGTDFNYGGQYQYENWLFIVASRPHSPSYYWPKMGNGEEELYLAPHDSPPLEEGATFPNPVTSTSRS